MTLKKISKIVEYIVLPLLLFITLESISAMIDPTLVVNYNLIMNIIIGPVFLLIYIASFVITRKLENSKAKYLSIMYLLMGITYIGFSKKIALSTCDDETYVTMMILVILVGILFIINATFVMFSDFKIKSEVITNDVISNTISSIAVATIFSVVSISILGIQASEDVYDALNNLMTISFCFMPLILSLIMFCLNKTKLYKTNIVYIALALIYLLVVGIGVEFFDIITTGLLYKIHLWMRFATVLHLSCAVYFTNILIKKTKISKPQNVIN